MSTASTSRRAAVPQSFATGVTMQAQVSNISYIRITFVNLDTSRESNDVYFEFKHGRVRICIRPSDEHADQAPAHKHTP